MLCVLATQSYYVCECRNSHLFSPNASPGVLRLIHTLYNLSAQVLLPAASLLQLMDVRQACCEFLQAQLHPTNCLGIRAFADLHACTDLLNHAHAYAGELFLISVLLKACGIRSGV